MCRDTDWSYGPIRVLFRAFCSLQAEGLFGQSFSVAPPIQALRGLPCLAPSLLFSACRDTEGSPWLGSYSVDRCVRHLRGTLRGVLFFSSAHQVFNRPDLLFSCRCWCVRRERLWWWLHLLWVTQQYCFASVTACLSSTGISHRDLLSHIPSIHFSAVSSSPRPGIAPQSVNSAAAPPSRPAFLSGSVWLWQYRFSFHLGCHRSATSLSALNVSSLAQTIALLWGLDPWFSSPTH